MHRSVDAFHPSQNHNTKADIYILPLSFHKAFKEAEACSVDVPFTAEEAWVWGQFERSIDDAHPDAHAVRLKLALAVQYSRSSNKVKWEQHREMDRYLAKLGHVTASCRLTYEEELDALHLSKQATPIIKSRLAYLKVTKHRSYSTLLIPPLTNYSFIPPSPPCTLRLLEMVSQILP